MLISSSIDLKSMKRPWNREVLVSGRLGRSAVAGENVMSTNNSFMRTPITGENGAPRRRANFSKTAGCLTKVRLTTKWADPFRLRYD